MEEVDSIILHFLRQLNINIVEHVKSISDLSVEIIIEAASACIHTIDPSLKVARNLPSGISHRIEVAAQIASVCKDLGYKNDVGYQTFLYHNESELRHVFMFLIERLPNEGKHVPSSTHVKKKSVLLQEIGIKIGEELGSIWMPPSCKPSSQVIGDFKNSATKSLKTSQTNLSAEELIFRILKMQGFKKDKQIIIKPVVHDEQVSNILSPVDKNEDKVKPQINKSLKELKEMAIILRQKLDKLESERNVMNMEYSQTDKSCERVEADLKNVENILLSIGISDIDSESNVDALLEKVQKNIGTLHKKSEDITSQNLSLKGEIDKLKANLNLSESERMQCRKILGNLKNSAKTLKEEYEAKEILRNQLKSSYDKLKGGNKRSVYTKRIMEIISNVDKQNMEIKKVLDDTRQIQKEINTLEGQLDRCFSIADETLFRDAKKDDQAKKAYKLLALLHSECNTIVSLVNDTGVLARDIVDLEENIKTESAKRTEDTLRKIQIDLSQIQQESAGAVSSGQV